MRGTAHLVIGAAAGLAVGVALHAPLPLAGTVGAVSGLLPDIDHQHSTVGRIVPWPAVERPGRGGFVAHGRRWFGGRVIWHRGETHSVGAAGLAASITVGVVRLAVGWLAAHGVHLHPWALAGVGGTVMLAGYLSHLLADTVNRSPQMLWWPFRRRMVHPPWRGWPEASAAGRTAEVAAQVLAVCAAVALLPHP